MALVWQQPLTYFAPSYPGGVYYYIQYPGTDATQPMYHTFKAQPPNTSGLPVPAPGTFIGDYPTLAAAMSACNTDANPPVSGLTHQDLSQGIPRQPVFP